MHIVEADRDILDWSGRKALDYRKQSTSVSASTYSSKYDATKSSFIATGTQMTWKFDSFGGTMKLKRNKRFSTTTGAISRSQSMRGLIKSPAGDIAPSNRSTHFSPELDQGKRHQTRYRSILFRKKTVPITKSNFDQEHF